MVVPVFVRKLGGDALQLVGKAVFAGNVEAAFQRRRHGVAVLLRAVLPEEGAAGIFPAACIGDVEHISKPGPVAGGVDKGDAPGAAPDVPAHLLIPQVVFRAGRGVRALGEDHELFVVGVFVEPRGGGEKGRPLLVAAGDLRCRVVGHLGIGLDFTRHRQRPPRQNPGTGRGRHSRRRSWRRAFGGRCQ